MIYSTQIENATSGQDLVPLVMLHGLFGSAENLAGIARLLSKDFAVNAIDLPHHGRSVSDETVGLRNMVDAVADFLDLNFAGPVHLLGHSLGGKVAMELALLYPDQVEKLVVLDIAPRAYDRRHTTIFQAIDAVSAASPQSRREADGILKAAIPELAVRSFILKNWQRNEQGICAWRCNMRGLKDAYDDLVGSNANEVFDRPSLFLAGGESDYIQPEDHPAIVHRFPEASVVVLSGLAHWLHAEAPELVAQKIGDFLLQN